MAVARRRGEVSLDRALSKLGLASRTQAREWILGGRVSIDGVVSIDPGRAVVPERVRIEVGGEPVTRQSSLTIALHKPRRAVTTRTDPEGRPTVFDSLAGVDRHVMPVGRLDLSTSGLLLLTNDTRLSAWLTDPANEVPRVYVVTVRGRFDQEAARRAKEGLVDRGERLSARGVEVLKISNRETHLRLELIEGRNREIRRLMAALGHEVTRLKRISIGGIELGSLATGAWRIVGPAELRDAFPAAPMRDAVGGPARGSGAR